MMGRWWERIFVGTVGVGALLFGGFGHAETPRFELPVECMIGVLCSIQKYMDHDPGPGRIDYACGRLSLDGDTGTDFRLPDLPAMGRGVAVLAAAPGRVKAVRDGLADISVREIGQAALGGRWGGNGVVIDHGDGWETQYSHLRNGTVAVRVGEAVTVGQVLGLIGLSGNTEFPHVEFAVRYEGRPVDPFVGTVPFRTCRDPRAPLWSERALRQLSYTPTGILIAGFADHAPTASEARTGRLAAAAFKADAAALVFWVDLYGAIAGDRQVFHLIGPDGRALDRVEQVLGESNISWFAFSGKKRPATGWLPGVYQATYTLTRGNAVVATVTRTARVEPN